MRAILAQSFDQEEALEGFDMYDARTWTGEEKQKDQRLYLRLNFVYSIIF
jgi:hypothetical protein